MDGRTTPTVGGSTPRKADCRGLSKTLDKPQAIVSDGAICSQGVVGCTLFARPTSHGYLAAGHARRAGTWSARDWIA